MTKRLLTLFIALFAFVGITSMPVAAADDLTRFQAMINQFAVENGQPTVRFYNIPSGGSVRVGTTIYSSLNTMLYERDYQTVIIGEDAVYNLAANSHWIVPGIISAHEWGHSVWRKSGITSQRQAVEDGADCIAGAWLGWINRREQLGISIFDLPGLGAMVEAIARNERTPVGDNHGTFNDRSVAMTNGYLYGYKSCEWFKQFL